MVDGLTPPTVEVVHAGATECVRMSVEWRDGDTVADVLARSGALDRFPVLRNAPLGIFGRLCEPTTPVRPGDRVEVYRPLLADPKQARRVRAARQPMLKGRARPG